MYVPDLVILMDDEYRHQLTELGRHLSIPVIEINNDTAVDKRLNHSIEQPYALQIQQGALCLQEQGVKTGPVFVDFLGGSSTYRRTKGGGELIVKAMGGSKKKQQRPTILDITAGLGRDSFVLASWGFSVQMLERSAIVAALLNDGLLRASMAGDFELQDVVARLQLWQGESQDYMAKIMEADKPDVIYMDPMFPPSKKSALVKKEMRAFHYIVGEEGGGGELLGLARQKARYRVVVKRPKKAVFLADQKPSFSLEGKAIRFDVYSVKAFPK